MIQVNIKRKILVLHGYGQSAYMASRILSSTIKECDNDLEFVFLDAPLVLIPVDPVRELGTPAAITPGLSVPPACSKPTLSPPYSAAPRGWFKIFNSTMHHSMPGLEASLLLLRDTLRENRFEAIFGFSQGAALAELIAAMLERPHLYPLFCENGQAPHPPLRFIVSVAGFLLRGPLASWESDSPSTSAFYQDPSSILHTPVLHVIGRTDVVVVRERSNVVMSFSKNKRVEEHIGGHFIPTRPRWRRFFAEFFRDPFGEIVSPSPHVKEEVYRILPPSAESAVRNHYISIGETLQSISATGEEREEMSSGTLTPESTLPLTPSSDESLISEYFSSSDEETRKCSTECLPLQDLEIN